MNSQRTGCDVLCPCFPRNLHLLLAKLLRVVAAEKREQIHCLKMISK